MAYTNRDAMGRVVWATRSGGLAFDYNTFNAVTQDPAGSFSSTPNGLAASVTYGYNNNHDADAIQNNATVGQSAQRQCFVYDHLRRLTHAFTGTAGCASPDLVAGPAPFDRTYGYDEIGNLTYDSSIGTLTYGSGTAGPHAVTSTGAGDVYAYATDGVMTARNQAGPDLQSMFYTADNTMWYELGTASSAVHYYDADGSRVLTNRSGTGTNTSTVTLGGLFERRVDNATGQVTDTSFYDGGDGKVAAMSVDGTVVQVYTNQIGSITATWNTATGVINHQYYYPYGEIRQTDGLDTTLGYTGQRHDPTGLIYYQARYYDPHTGRFTQPDTIVPGGGADPQGLNRYTYVINNPVNYNDPTGHDYCLGGGGGCGGVRQGDANGDGTVPIQGADCGPGCGTEAFWYPIIGSSVGGHPYTPAPLTDEVQAAADAADASYRSRWVVDAVAARVVQPVWDHVASPVARCFGDLFTCGDNLQTLAVPVIIFDAGLLIAGTGVFAAVSLAPETGGASIVARQWDGTAWV